VVLVDALQDLAGFRFGVAERASDGRSHHDHKLASVRLGEEREAHQRSQAHRRDKDQRRQSDRRHAMSQRPRDDAAIPHRHSIECSVKPTDGTHKEVALAFVMRLRPHRRHHRIERERHKQRQQHRDADGDAKLEEKAPDDAAHKRHRHEHRDDRKRRCKNRQTDLVGTFLGGADVVFAHLGVSDNVFAHHDRVVDEQSNRQRQRQQRQLIESKARRPDRRKRPNHRDRQRQSGDHRRAPALQKQKDDRHRQDRAEQQVFLDLLDRRANEDRVVNHHVEDDILRQIHAQLGHPLSDRVGDLHRVLAGLLANL
jgi:hypothetical protein